MFPSPGYVIIASNDFPGASTWTWNCLFQSGYLRMSALVRLSFNVSNTTSHSLDHMKRSNLLRSFSSGVVIEA